MMKLFLGKNGQENKGYLKCEKNFKRNILKREAKKKRN